jgi:hypothetical protein
MTKDQQQQQEKEAGRGAGESDEDRSRGSEGEEEMAVGTGGYCGPVAETLDAAVQVLVAAWKEEVVWGGLREDAPVPDAEVRALIKELHEVQVAILPDGVKYKKVAGTPNTEKFADTGPDIMRSRVAMTLLTWGPLHKGNWESTKASIGDEVWLQRMRFEALLRGRAPPEDTRAGEEMLQSDEPSPWLVHFPGTLGQRDKLSVGLAPTGAEGGMCEEHGVTLPCARCVMAKEAKAMEAQVAGKQGRKRRREDDLCLEYCEEHDLGFPRGGVCARCALWHRSSRRG